MKKKLTKKKIIIRTVTKKQLVIVTILSFILSIVIALGAIGLAYQQLITKENESSISKIAYFIDSATRNLSQITPQVDYTDNYFVQGAKIQFTSNDHTILRHMYDDSINSTIYLTSDVLLDSSSNKIHGALTFEQSISEVPNFQNCSRVSAITFNEQRPANYEDYVANGNKKLQDGRTAYFWKLPENLCKEYELVDSLNKIIQTIESFN